MTQPAAPSRPAVRRLLHRAGQSRVMARARTRPAFSSAEAHARDWMWRLDHRSGGPLSRLPPRQALRLVYDAILHREPDPAAA